MTFYYDPKGGEFPKPPQGTWRFRVTRMPKDDDRTKAGKKYYKFFFSIIFPDGNEQDYQENFFPWREEYRDLLLALGGKEDDKGRVQIDKEESIIGKVIQADIVYETPTGSDKSFAHMKNIVACDQEPFEAPEQEEEEEVPEPPDDEGSDDQEVPF